MNKRILAVILVLSMMTMGAAYAAWTQTVTVSGDIDTGVLKVSAQMSGYTIEDMGTRTNSHTDPFFTQSAVVIEATADSVNGTDNQTLKINLSEFYPGLRAKGTVEFTNASTMPVYLQIQDTVDEQVFASGDVTFSLDDSSYVSAAVLNGLLNSSAEELAVDGATKVKTIYFKVEAPLDTVIAENDAIGSGNDYSFSIPIKAYQFNAEASGVATVPVP